MLYLYPTIVVVLSAIFFKQRITGRIIVALVLSYVGILLVFARDLELAGDPGALWLGAALVFASSFLYACYLVGVGPVIARLGSLRFIALAMLTSALFIFAHFLATRPLTALLVPVRIHLLSLTMAVFSTVLPTYLIAEAIKRIGASRTSLLGSMGPLFTIWLGSWLLDEPVHAIQLVGAALVLAGVALVTLRPARTDAAPAAPPWAYRGRRRWRLRRDQNSGGRSSTGPVGARKLRRKILEFVRRGRCGDARRGARGPSLRLRLIRHVGHIVCDGDRSGRGQQHRTLGRHDDKAEKHEQHAQTSTTPRLG